MSEDVVWGNTTLALSQEGREEVLRCKGPGCGKLFRRPLGSSASHSETDETASCPPGTPSTTNLAAGRWVR